MDPDASWRIVTDTSCDLDERAVAATDLLVWLATHGHNPGDAADREAVVDTCRHQIFKALDRLEE